MACGRLGGRLRACPANARHRCLGQGVDARITDVIALLWLTGMSLLAGCLISDSFAPARKVSAGAGLGKDS